jgi:pyruvate dehydrogenase E2 component (dihydrolipoamide acetyltransferase)
VAFEFRLPDIGEGLTEAEVIRWLVEVGQEVALDQPLVEVETDKALTEIPSPRAGVLVAQGAPAGTVVHVGEVLAVIGAAGEVVGIGSEPAAPRSKDGPARRPDSAAPIVGTIEDADAGPTAGATRALPLVRKLARDLGVDLEDVRGTGPGGRILREDMEAAAGGAARPSAGAEERVRMSRLRRTVAERMARSWREIPHVTTFDEADATALQAVRSDLSERLGTAVSHEALFVRAVLPLLAEHPEFNASLDGDDVILKRHYDIGIAVDTPEGLIVPVIRGADRLGIAELSAEILRLGRAARDRTAQAAELTGATFTVSNIGAVGGGFGTPIIPWGTTAILSVGRAAGRVVPAPSGGVEVVPMMPLSLSYDHRLIDGVLGRRFMAAVVQALARPADLTGPVSMPG